jgi:hypothetical protein
MGSHPRARRGMVLADASRGSTSRPAMGREIWVAAQSADCNQRRMCADWGHRLNTGTRPACAHVRFPSDYIH